MIRWEMKIVNDQKEICSVKIHKNDNEKKRSRKVSKNSKEQLKKKNNNNNHQLSPSLTRTCYYSLWCHWACDTNGSKVFIGLEIKEEQEKQYIKHEGKTNSWEISFLPQLRQ